MTDIEMRKELSALGSKLCDAGYIRDLQGNFSIFDREHGLVYITPGSLPYAHRTPDDICVTNLQRRQVSGQRRPTSEIALHLEIYKNRPDICAVVHTHPVNAGTFAIARLPIPQVLETDAMGFCGEVPVAEFAPHGTPELAKNALAALAPDKNACLLSNHGLVTAAKTLESAVFMTKMTEDAAKMILLARAAGYSIKEL